MSDPLPSMPYSREIGAAAVVRRGDGKVLHEPTDLLHFVFVCTVTTEEPTVDGAEITESGWWASDSLPRPISDFTVRRIRDALAGNVLPLPGLVGPRQWLLPE